MKRNIKKNRYAKSEQMHIAFCRKNGHMIRLLFQLNNTKNGSFFEPNHIVRTAQKSPYG